MKTLSVFVLLLIGVIVWQYTKISALNERVASLDQQLRPQPRAAPKPISSVKHVTCPLCHGERAVIYDSGGRNDPVDRKMENCPVCLAVGYRNVQVFHGQKLCPDCEGMGLVWSTEPGHPVRTANCARCAGTGVIADIRSP